MKENIYNVLTKYILKNKFFYYFCLMILFLILEISELNIKLQNYEIQSKLYVYILIGIAFIIGILFFTIIKIKKNIENYKLFAILASVVGLMYLIGAPMFAGSDEHNHYYRIFEITQGKLITPVSENNVIGSELPVSLYESFLNNDEEILNRNQRIKYKDEIETYNKEINKDEKIQYGTNYANEYENTALYCPLQYLPQIIGFFLGESINASPLIIGQLGRLFNLFFYIVICTYFIKRLPKFQVFSMLMLLSPTLIGNVTTLNADGFTAALIFGFLTLIIIYSKNNERIKKFDKILLIILSLFISSCKIVYIPFIFLLFLLPNSSFKSRKEKYFFNIFCVLIGIMINYIWLRYTDIYFELYYVKSEIQKQNILCNPIWYGIVIFRSYIQYFAPLIYNIVGGNQLYHCQLSVYNVLSLTYIIILASSVVVYEKNKIEKPYSKIQHVIISLVALTVFVLITTAIYVQCTANFLAINSSTVVGLQGRYFVPILLMIILMLNKEKIQSKIKINKSEYLIDISLLIHFIILLQMFVCFSI